MTKTVTLIKTGFDATSDNVASATMVTFAQSAETEFANILNGIEDFNRQLFTADITYQISAGAIDTPTQHQITVAAESGTIDTLDTIGISNNRSLRIQAASGQTITLSSGVGNITTLDGTSLILSGNRMALLYCQGSQWSVVGTGSGVQDNTTATTDPGSGDDSGDGYSVGSLWGNTTRDQVYVNLDATLGAGIWRRISPKKNGFSIRAAAATVATVGIAAITPTNSGANANDANNTFIALGTTASIGTVSGVVSTTFNLVRPAHDPVFECILKTDSTITAMRLWVGLISADVTNVDTLAAGTKFIGFRWSTVAGDAGFVPVLNDGTTQNTGTAIGTVLASTQYKLRFRVDSANSKVYFSVNDSAEQMMSTNFPASTTDLGAAIRIIDTTAANRIFNFASAEVWW